MKLRLGTLAGLPYAHAFDPFYATNSIGYPVFAAAQPRLLKGASAKTNERAPRSREPAKAKPRSSDVGPSVLLHALEGADECQQHVIACAVERLGEAVADSRFLTAVVDADYVETRWTPLDGQWRALTGAEIAERIGAGLERGSKPDGAIDLSFELIDLPGPETGRQVLGSTFLGCQPIRTARWFVDRCETAGDPVNLASHFMHEWMHLSGFYHWPDNKARGDAAYVVGRLVREMLADRHGGEIDPNVTELMHDIETDCGCRGNPEGGTPI
jgi:hypothetical protein